MGNPPGAAGSRPRAPGACEFAHGWRARPAGALHRCRAEPARTGAAAPARDVGRDYIHGDAGGRAYPSSDPGLLRRLRAHAILVRRVALHAEARAWHGLSARRSLARTGGARADDRRMRAHAQHVPLAGEGRAQRRAGVHLRRIGHGQGTRGPGHPRSIEPPQGAVRGDQLRRDSIAPRAIGTVRLREGRVHRREPAQDRLDRAGPGRHAVPR